jgi:hypothetical protein
MESILKDILTMNIRGEEVERCSIRMETTMMGNGSWIKEKEMERLFLRMEQSTQVIFKTMKSTGMVFTLIKIKTGMKLLRKRVSSKTE